MSHPFSGMSSRPHRNISPENRNEMIVTATGAYSIDYEAGYEARKERMRGGGVVHTDASRNLAGNDSLSPGIASHASGYPASLNRYELINNIGEKYDQERSRSKSGDGRSRSREAAGRDALDSNPQPQPRRYAP